MLLSPQIFWIITPTSSLQGLRRSLWIVKLGGYYVTRNVTGCHTFKYDHKLVF